MKAIMYTGADVTLPRAKRHSSLPADIYTFSSTQTSGNSSKSCWWSKN